MNLPDVDPVYLVMISCSHSKSEGSISTIAAKAQGSSTTMPRAAAAATAYARTDDRRQNNNTLILPQTLQIDTDTQDGPVDDTHILRYSFSDDGQSLTPGSQPSEMETDRLSETSHADPVEYDEIPDDLDNLSDSLDSRDEMEVEEGEVEKEEDEVPDIEVEEAEQEEEEVEEEPTPITRTVSPDRKRKRTPELPLHSPKRPTIVPKQAQADLDSDEEQDTVYTRKEVESEEEPEPEAETEAVEEVEEAAEIEEEPELDEAQDETEREERNRHRMEAMAALRQIELDFAHLRAKLHEERMQQLDMEIALTEAGEHPLLIAKAKQNTARHSTRRQRALVQRDSRRVMVDLEHKAHLFMAHSQFSQERQKLRANLLSKTSAEWFQIHREKRILDMAVPEYGFVVPDRKSVQIKHRREFDAEVAILTGLKKYVGFPAAPPISTSTQKETDADFAEMGIYRGLGLKKVKPHHHHHHKPPQPQKRVEKKLPLPMPRKEEKLPSIKDKQFDHLKKNYPSFWNNQAEGSPTFQNTYIPPKPYHNSNTNNKNNNTNNMSPKKQSGQYQGTSTSLFQRSPQLFGPPM